MTIPHLIQDLKQKNKTDVIFDFDETICTLHIDWNNWYTEMTAFTQTYDPEFGNMFDNKVRNASVKRLGHDFWEKLVEKNIEVEGKYISGHTWNEKCVELVHECVEAGMRVHLWTSNCRETVEPVMGEKLMGEQFTHKVFYNDVMSIKPDPEGFGKINEGGLDVGRFLFVGDSNADRGACEAAGIEYVDVGEMA